jgi:hypothetical protein
VGAFSPGVLGTVATGLRRARTKKHLRRLRALLYAPARPSHPPSHPAPRRVLWALRREFQQRTKNHKNPNPKPNPTTPFTNPNPTTPFNYSNSTTLSSLPSSSLYKKATRKARALMMRTPSLPIQPQERD